MTTEITDRASSALVARLVAMRPADTDRALQSLATSHKVGCEISLRYPDASAPIVSGVRISGGDVARVLDGYRKAMTPATDRHIEDWIAELSVIAPRRSADAVTVAMTVRAYSERLREYPADVAREALLGRAWRFFPSWAELRDACDDLVSERRMTLAALERASVAPMGPPRDIGTAEARAAHAARVMADVFGDKRMGAAE